jgi:hypothetical protein
MFLVEVRWGFVLVLGELYEQFALKLFVLEHRFWPNSSQIPLLAIAFETREAS